MKAKKFKKERCKTLFFVTREDNNEIHDYLTYEPAEQHLTELEKRGIKAHLYMMEGYY